MTTTVLDTKKAIPQDHLAVYEVIANHSEKYVTRSMILSQLDKNGDYGRRLSEIIYNLIVKYNASIGSSSRKGHKGYFMIETEYDKNIAVGSIKSRMTSYSERYRATQNMEVI